MVGSLAGNLSRKANDCLDRESEQGSSWVGCSGGWWVVILRPSADVTCPEYRQGPSSRSLRLAAKHLFIWLPHWKHRPRPDWHGDALLLSHHWWCLAVGHTHLHTLRTHAFHTCMYTHCKALIYESTNSLDFPSVLRSKTGFCQDVCWHISQQKGGGAQGRWKSWVESEPKRHDRLSFFLLCWSCERGGIYNARTYSRF